MTFPKADGGQVSLVLTARQQEVLTLIRQKPGISRKELSKKLEINESAVQKHLEAIKSKGAIEREGETTGYWKIHI